MRQYLKKSNVEIEVLNDGAELVSLKVNGKEQMWDRNPEYWAKTSPVLFPFIGTIKDGHYNYNGKEYVMDTRHGFARDMQFNLSNKGEDFLEFLLSSSTETLKNYPFEFDFYITYRILKNGVAIEYRVENKTDGDMYFSVGAHPAFKLDTSNNKVIQDYYIEFENKETLDRLPLDGTLISDKVVPFLKDENKIKITSELFSEDAIIFKNSTSNKVSIKCNKDSSKLTLDYKGFQYIAFWSPKNAPFVCLEPWYGISDFVNTTGNLEEKEGIQKLGKKEIFNAVMSIMIEE